jgi:hypothetical protein
MSSYFKFLKSVWADVLAPAGSDIFRSAPDSVFIGTSLFALLTQNYTLGILVLAMAELGLVNRFFGGLFSAVQDNSSAQQVSDACLPGIPSPYQISAIGKLLSTTAFPSGPTFFISGTLTYIMMSIQNFYEELKTLGQRDSSWLSRTTASMVLSLLFIGTFMLYRILNECEPILTSVASAFLGAFFGMIIMNIHSYVFGRNGINFLGLPILTNTFTEENPLQLCARVA